MEEAGRVHEAGRWVMTHTEWITEGEKRFGTDIMDWAFVCPSCGHIATTRDWKEAGAKAEHVAFSCIGRWTGSKKQIFDKTGGPCNYAGGGLLRLNPIEVNQEGAIHRVFAFSEVPPC
jgi:hypothetical protein